MAGMSLEVDEVYDAEFAREARLRGFAGEVLLETAAGPIVAWERVGEGPRVYVSSGIHGDEPAGPLAMLELMKGGDFVEGIHWMLVPKLNPAGLLARTRENSSGVDLNRDYLLRSTAEVAAHVRWLEKVPVPDLFLSLHEDWETRGFYLYEINLGEDRPERTRSIIEAVGPWFEAERGPLIDDHEAREDGWIYHAAEADVPEGWPEAIYVAKRGCALSYTFETPSSLALEDRVASHVAGVRQAIGWVV
jgi:predicted deacylase